MEGQVWLLIIRQGGEWHHFQGAAECVPAWLSSATRPPWLYAFPLEGTCKVSLFRNSALTVQSIFHVQASFGSNCRGYHSCKVWFLSFDFPHTADLNVSYPSEPSFGAARRCEDSLARSPTLITSNWAIMILEAYFDHKCRSSDDSILYTSIVAKMIVLSCFVHKYCFNDDCANGWF